MPRPTFRIGLTMAGAVSAGAYTGGAMAFLFEALDAWEAAKAGTDAPQHDVRIEVMSGASAGGITSGIVATRVRRPFGTVFHDTWVDIDIADLLATRDLAGGGPVMSLLDSTALDRLADRVFGNVGGGLVAPRPYFADPLGVALTVTNLRGVPYTMQFTGGSGPLPYTMTTHADQVTFAVSPPVPAPPVAGVLGSVAPTPISAGVPLDPTDLQHPNWRLLREAALATGAFPIGLAPRLLSQNSAAYDARQWFFPREGRMGTLSPSFGVPPFNYNFLCVDGGTIDNEPVNLARFHLTPQDPTGTNTQGPEAMAAVVMIDPFPDAPSFQTAYDPLKDFSLFKIVGSIIGALVHQARFKPEELTRGADPHIYNQFLLIPSRPSENGPATFPLACGGLGGFAGFLSSEFREHDYHLGRRNMQQFLAEGFALPEMLGGTVHPLFQQWSFSARDAHRFMRNGVAMLPIVPLIGALRTNVEFVPPFPRYTRQQFGRLRTQILARADAIFDAMTAGQSFLQRNALRAVWSFKRRAWIEEYALGKVRDELTARGQMANSTLEMPEAVMDMAAESAPVASAESVDDLLAQAATEPPTLDWLKEALQLAVQVELATLPPYLTARWTVKATATDPVAKSIREVRGEEMLHLGLVCNMLAALGGTPVLTGAAVPTYPSPLPGGVRPGLVVALRKLDAAQLDTFMQIEFPQGGPISGLESTATFNTIGEFYTAIWTAFQTLNPPLSLERQLEGPLGLVKVGTLAEVKAAIDLICLQGEGTSGSPEEAPGDLSHYYRFAEVHRGQRAVKNAATGQWGFTGDVVPMPEVWPMADIPAGGYQPTDVPDAAVRAMITDFDAAYSEMLRALENAWANGGDDALSAAIGAMIQIGTLGRNLVKRPRPDGTTYGPCFRYV